MTHYVCTNCGFWQRHFAAPLSCPVCLDFRHTPPESGWEFLSAADASRVASTSWTEDDNGVVAFRCSQRWGIGPRGYLLRHTDGNVVFDHCAWYDDAALDAIERHGGVRWLLASHPHAYGALWRLQERFPEAQVAIPVDDLLWTGAFRVTHPVDDSLEIARGVFLYKTGGHFAGHAVLNWVARDLLFAGDLIKLHFDAAGALAGLSTHKAFNRRVPMSRDELQRYAERLSLLFCSTVYTTFDQARCPAKKMTGLIKHLLESPPTVDPVPLDKL